MRAEDRSWFGAAKSTSSGGGNAAARSDTALLAGTDAQADNANVATKESVTVFFNLRTFFEFFIAERSV